MKLGGRNLIKEDRFLEPFLARLAANFRPMFDLLENYFWRTVGTVSSVYIEAYEFINFKHFVYFDECDLNSSLNLNFEKLTIFFYFDERDLNSSLNPVFIILIFTLNYRSVTLTHVWIRFFSLNWGKPGLCMTLTLF